MGIRDEERSGILDQGVEGCEEFDWGVPVEGAMWGKDVGVSAIDFFYPVVSGINA